MPASLARSARSWGGTWSDELEDDPESLVFAPSAGEELPEDDGEALLLLSAWGLPFSCPLPAAAAAALEDFFLLDMAL